MTILIPTRRGLFKVLGGIIAAPAIIKAESLMKIVPYKSHELPTNKRIDEIIELLMQHNEILDGLEFSTHEPIIRTSLPIPTWRKLNFGVL